MSYPSAQRRANLAYELQSIENKLEDAKDQLVALGSRRCRGQRKQLNNELGRLSRQRDMVAAELDKLNGENRERP